MLAAYTAAGLIPLLGYGALQDDLVVHLPFDSNYEDSTSRNNDGTAVGTPTFGAGAIGQAVFVSNAPDSGDLSYVTLGVLPDVLVGDSTDFSVSMWVQLNQFGGDPSFFSNKDWNGGGNRGYVLATDNDRRVQWNYTEAGNGRRDYDGPGGTMVSNTWVHLAMTVQRTGNISTYVNGQLVNETRARATAETPAGTLDTDEFGLSVNIGNDGTGFYGSTHVGTGIDDFGLWRRSLAGSEVARIYSFGRGGTNLSRIPEPTVASIQSLAPADASTGIIPTPAIRAVIANAGTTVVTQSIQLTFNGTVVAPTLTATTTNVTVEYIPSLLPSGSTNSYRLVFADSASTRFTNSATFVVRSYTNLVLPAPIYFETFDAVAEGGLPAGWVQTNYTTVLTETEDLNDPNSNSYLGWTAINRDRVLSANWNGNRRLLSSEPVVNGVVIANLVSNTFLYAESDSRGGSQIQYLYSPDFNMAGKSNVYLAYNCIYDQNQDSIGAVEYSVDGGASWLPIVYMIDRNDIIRTEAGDIDAIATLNEPRGDTASYSDPETGEILGGTYGSFIAAPITEALAPYISGRIDDDSLESKRVDFFRLPAADNSTRVRLRFAQAGTGSWYFGIDNVGFYSISATPPAPVVASAALTGGDLVISWTGGTGPFLVQGKVALTDSWIDLKTTTERSTAIPMAGFNGFFRVVDGTTKTVRLFKATLNGANERPTPVTTTGTGTGLLALDGLTATFLVRYQGLTAVPSAYHLHGLGGPEQAVGVKFNLVPAGTLTASAGLFAGQSTVDQATADGIIAGQTYFNVHTATNPGGEIRGQVVIVP